MVRLPKDRTSRRKILQAARRVLIASAAFTVAAILAVAAFPVPIGQAVGTISIFAIFVGCLALNATGLSLWSHRLDFPIIPTMIAVAVFLALGDLNDNHELRRVDKNGRAVSSSVAQIAEPERDVADEFEKWYHARIDKEQFGEGTGYPVYIVAAQGGGIYAAAQALQFLTDFRQRARGLLSTCLRLVGFPGGVSALHSTLR